MSWSIQYASKNDLNDDKRGANSAKDADLSEAAKEQVKMAIESAVAIIASGVVGNEKKDYIVAISGHANDGHEPRPSYANDCITVSVWQASTIDEAIP